MNKLEIEFRSDLFCRIADFWSHDINAVLNTNLALLYKTIEIRIADLLIKLEEIDVTENVYNIIIVKDQEKERITTLWDRDYNIKFFSKFISLKHLLESIFEKKSEFIKEYFEKLDKSVLKTGTFYKLLKKLCKNSENDKFLELCEYVFDIDITPNAIETGVLEYKGELKPYAIYTKFKYMHITMYKVITCKSMIKEEVIFETYTSDEFDYYLKKNNLILHGFLHL